METTTPEISPPVGYFRADEALKRWLEIRHGHDEPQGLALATMLDASRSRKSVVAGLKARKGLMFLVDSNGEWQDVDPDQWKSDDFLFRELTTQGPKPSGQSLLCISQNEIERWARQELREWLINELKYSRLDLDKARDVWAKAGTGNLEGNPDPAEFDPMAETFWTLPMAVAWMAWGDPQEVVKQWDNYRNQCSHFHRKIWHFPEGPEHEGWVFDNDEPANLDFLISGNWTPAKQKLWRALQAGDLTATGFDPDGYRLLIDAFLWQDHGATLEAWKDITVASKDVLLITTLDKTEATTKSKPRKKRADPKRLTAFLETRYRALKDADYPPTETEDWKAALKDFPEIARKQIRDFRGDVLGALGLDSWLKTGPRKTVGELRSVNYYAVRKG